MTSPGLIKTLEIGSEHNSSQHHSHPYNDNYPINLFHLGILPDRDCEIPSTLPAFLMFMVFNQYPRKSKN